MTALLPLMLVPLLVWIAVWSYLRMLDSKVRNLRQDLARLESREDEDR
jgi:hypothetical protein